MRGGDWTIDHVAIVVADLEATIGLYTQTLGMPLLYRETIAELGVEAIGIASGDSSIELLRPLDESSAIARFRGDAATKLHHVAYRVTNIEAELARLQAAGVRLIDVVPRRGAHGKVVAFLHPQSTAGVLTELCERRPGEGV